MRELLDASETQEIRRWAAELKQVERRLAEVEADFAKNLALLKRDVLDEAEFRTANEARRDERARLPDCTTPRWHHLSGFSRGTSCAVLTTVAYTSTRAERSNGPRGH